MKFLKKIFNKAANAVLHTPAKLGMKTDEYLSKASRSKGLKKRAYKAAATVTGFGMMAAALPSAAVIYGRNAVDGMKKKLGLKDRGAPKRSLKDSFFDAGRPMVFGHRGAAGDMPENTFPSFDRALKDGADVLETDVHLTKDGEVVVFHDDMLDGTTDGKGRIEDHTLAELKALDAAYHFTRDGGKTHPYRGKGVVIPTLDEVFERYPDVKFNVDMKSKSLDLVQKVSDLLDKHNRTHLTIMGSFNKASIKKLRDLQPDMLTCASDREAKTFLLAEKLRLPSSKTNLAFEVPVKTKGVNVVTEHFIKQARKKGNVVVPWTINDPKEMKKLLKMGVDGIITDHPKLAADVIRKHKP